MQVADLPRTTGFRLALLFLGLLGVASLSSLSLAYVDTAGLMSKHMDDWLRHEETSLLAMEPSALPQQLQRHALYDTGSAWPIMLYGPNGHLIAGETTPLPKSLPPDGEPFVFRAPSHGQLHRFRGLVERLADGNTLLISERLWWASSLDHVLIVRTIWGLGIAAGVGLGIAALLGAREQRRIAAFTRVAQTIVSGDLSGRLPIQNRSDDLDRLAAVVNGMLDHIERLVLQIGSFRDAVSHDLLTPLTRLHVTLEGTRAGSASRADYEDGIDIALQESRRLSALLAAIRRLSEIESGARRAGFASVDLDGLATEVFDFYQPVAEERGVSLSLADLGHRCLIRGDHDLLFEALGNLLDNAIKFTPASGTVTLTAFDGEAPGFSVADTGPGIPVAEQTAVLRRYYRLEGGRTMPGSGLGLALVSAIAELHGMTLTITQPIAQDPACGGIASSPGCLINLRCQNPLPSRSSGGASVHFSDAVV